MPPFDHLLVPTDFSPSAQCALEKAVVLAKHLGASLTLLHVIELPVYAYDVQMANPVDILTPARAAAEQAMTRLLAEVRAQVPGASSLLRVGRTADEIVDAVRATGADLVVIGTHGRTGILHLLLGSVAEKVVRLAPVPVLSVRGGDLPVRSDAPPVRAP